jgi:hypothetical protein
MMRHILAAGIKKPAGWAGSDRPAIRSHVRGHGDLPIWRGRNSKYQFRRIIPFNPIRQALFEKYFWVADPRHALPPQKQASAPTRLCDRNRGPYGRFTIESNPGGRGGII